MAKNISNLDKSLKQNITPADIGAAPTSHGTHLTIGTGASNAAAGNHTHSNYATTTQLTTTNNNIGTLSSLQTSNKSNLVAAINEVFQSGANVKQKLVDALAAKGTEASTSMTWDALIELIGTLKGTITYTGTFLPIATGQQHTIIYRTADSTIWGAGYNYYGQLGLTPSTYNVFKNTGFTKENIKQIECGYSHTCILLNNGELHIAGYNKFGQFGINSTSTQFNYFKLVRSDVKYVSCGAQFTFIITNNDEVYAAGYNNSGQLGIAGTTTVMSFTKVPISNIIKIACGNNYTLALRNDGTVWVTGYNGYGSLGLGDTADRSAFTQVIGIEGAKDIFAGNSSINSYILTDDGSVYGMGENNYGSVGDGSYVSRNAPVKISSLSVTGATSPTAVKQIAAGYHFAVAVLNNGKVKVAGANHSGQIGLGTTPTQNSFITPSEISGKTIVGAACGYEHTILLASDNTIWGTGRSTCYQLGSGTDRTTFTSIYTL